MGKDAEAGTGKSDFLAGNQHYIREELKRRDMVAFLRMILYPPRERRIELTGR